MVKVVLTPAEALIVRGRSPIAGKSYAALNPRPLDDGTLVLDEKSLTDPNHADVADYLGDLPTVPTVDPSAYATVAEIAAYGYPSLASAGIRQFNNPPVPRPAGLSYIPPYAGSAYQYLLDIPNPALWYDNGNAGGPFTTIAAAITAARAANLPLVLTQGGLGYSGNLHSFSLPHGLYAAGPLGSVVITLTGYAGSTAQPCFGYIKDRDFTVRGLQFEGFADTIGYCVRSFDRGGGVYQFHAENVTRFRRCAPIGVTVNGSAGVGIETDDTVYPRTVANHAGPAVEISDCKFVGCERAFYGISDTVVPVSFNAFRNDIVGTWGGFDLHFTSPCDSLVAGNNWHDVTIPSSLAGVNLNSNGLHAFFWTGTDSAVDLNLWRQTIRIESNAASDVTDNHSTDTIDCAVFADVRAVTPVALSMDIDDPGLCSINISFNDCRRLFGTKGQEDAQAIYTKTRGGVFQGNTIIACGSSNEVDAIPGSGDGSETTGILHKAASGSAPADGTQYFIADIANYFGDMPHVLSGSGMPFKISEVGATIDWHFLFNLFVRCSHAGTGTNPALVKSIDNIGRVKIIGTQFLDCLLEGSAQFIYLADLNPTPVVIPKSDYEISNNKAVWGPNVDYTGDFAGIRIGIGGDNGIITGHLTLEGSGGNHAMTITSFTGTGTAPVRNYDPPMVTL